MTSRDRPRRRGEQARTLITDHYLDRSPAPARRAELNTRDRTCVHELRELAKSLFMEGVRAADPAAALSGAWLRAPPPRPKPGGRSLIVAFGKASVQMLSRARELIAGGDAAESIAVTDDGNFREDAGFRVHAAGHPVPDERGIRAAGKVESLLAGAGRDDVVIVLVSGGGSALLPAPAGGLSLADKSAVTDRLLRAGFDIIETNAVRQHLSRLKGGGMLRVAHPAPVSAFILSDVPGDDLRVVASGPTASGIMACADAVRLLKERGVFAELPPRVREWLRKKAARDGLPNGTSEDAAVRNTLVGSNRLSLDAVAAADTGFPVTIADVGLNLEVSAAARRILDAAAGLPAGARHALVFGGETHVHVRGPGLGGRNQELALQVALGARQRRLSGDWAFLSGGTDGRDGPTDSAGGIVDPGSLNRMLAAGVEPEAMLARNDSYHALRASGDHLFTGATVTNVADIQIFVRG